MAGTPSPAAPYHLSSVPPRRSSERSGERAVDVRVRHDLGDEARERPVERRLERFIARRRALVEVPALSFRHALLDEDPPLLIGHPNDPADVSARAQQAKLR